MKLEVMPMDKYTKTVNMTYFIKQDRINIDDSINKIVYLEVDSPLNYGIRTWTYYGRIINITKCYFEIIAYCDGTLNSWRTDQIEIKEKKNIKKKWHKKSIQRLIEVKTEERQESMIYEKSEKE